MNGELTGREDVKYGDILQEEHGAISDAHRWYVKNIATNPEGMARLLQALYPELDIRVVAGQVLAKGEGEEKYRVLDAQEFTWKDWLDLPADFVWVVPEIIAAQQAKFATALTGPKGSILASGAAGATSAYVINKARQKIAQWVTRLHGGKPAPIDEKEAKISGLFGLLGIGAFGSGLSRTGVGKMAIKRVKEASNKASKAGLFKKGVKETAKTKKAVKSLTPLMKTVDPKFGTRTWHQDIRALQKYLSQQKGKKTFVPQNSAQNKLVNKTAHSIRLKDQGAVARTFKAGSREFGKLTGQVSQKQLDSIARVLPDYNIRQTPGATYSQFRRGTTPSKDKFIKRANEKAERLIKGVSRKAKEYRLRLGKEIEQSRDDFLKKTKMPLTGADELIRLYEPLITERKRLDGKLLAATSESEQNQIRTAIKEIDTILQPRITPDQMVISRLGTFAPLYEELAGGGKGLVFNTPEQIGSAIQEFQLLVKSMGRLPEGMTREQFKGALEVARKAYKSGELSLEYIKELSETSLRDKALYGIVTNDTKYAQTMRLLDMGDALEKEVEMPLDQFMQHLQEEGVDFVQRAKSLLSLRKRFDNVSFPLTEKDLNRFRAEQMKVRDKLDALNRKQKQSRKTDDFEYDNYTRRRQEGFNRLDEEYQQAIGAGADAGEYAKLSENVNNIKKTISDYNYDRNKRASIQALSEQIQALRVNAQDASILERRLQKLSVLEDDSKFLHEMVDFAEDLNQRAHDLGLLDKRLETATKRRQQAFSQRVSLNKKVKQLKDQINDALRNKLPKTNVSLKRKELNKLQSQLRQLNNKIDKLRKTERDLGRKTKQAQNWLDKRRDLEAAQKSMKDQLEQATQVTAEPPTARRVKDVYNKRDFQVLADDTTRQIQEIDAEIAMAKRAKNDARLSRLQQQRNDLVQHFEILKSYNDQLREAQMSLATFSRNTSMRQNTEKVRSIVRRKDAYDEETRIGKSQLLQKHKYNRKNEKRARRAGKEELTNAESVLITDAGYRQSRTKVPVGRNDELYIPSHVNKERLMGIYQTLRRASRFDIQPKDIPDQYERDLVLKARDAFKMLKQKIRESGDEGAEFVRVSEEFSEARPGLVAIENVMDDTTSGVEADDKLKFILDTFESKFDQTTDARRGLLYLKQREEEKMIADVLAPTEFDPRGPLEKLDISKPKKDDILDIGGEIQDIDDLVTAGHGKKDPWTPDKDAGSTSVPVQVAQPLGGPKAGGAAAVLSRPTEFTRDIPLWLMETDKIWYDALNQPPIPYGPTYKQGLIGGAAAQKNIKAGRTQQMEGPWARGLEDIEEEEEGI